MSRHRDPRPDSALSSAQVRTGHSLALGLRAAYLTMHRRANAVLAQYALTADQFVLLTTLAEGDGVTQKELGRRTNSDPNTMSEMLGRLERRGLLVRERHVDDGRALQVLLTETGRVAQQQAMEGVATFCESLANLIPTDEVDRLLGHLNQIVREMSVTDSPPSRNTGGEPPSTRDGHGASEHRDRQPRP